MMTEKQKEKQREEKYRKERKSLFKTQKEWGESLILRIYKVGKTKKELARKICSREHKLDRWIMAYDILVIPALLHIEKVIAEWETQKPKE